MDYPVDNEFKKNMNPKGKLYSFSEDLYGFPSTAAGLLKYKKHEWIIISFEKDKVISKVWANKGADRNGVSSCLTISEMIEIASRSGHTSILIFHNHPNPQPNHLDTSQASPQDILSAQEYAVALNKNDINLLEFVCERGNYHQYCISVAGTFLPVNIFMDKIIASNGTTRLKNLTLHVERIFF